MAESALRVSTDPRFGERRREIIRRRRRRLIATAILFAFVGGLTWLALFSSFLNVRHVKVLGGRHTTAAQVAEVAGLDENDNLLLLSTEDIAAAARGLPWVKSAVVTRSLPGTVRVKIVERTPAMVVSLGMTRWTVDSRGRVLVRGAVRKGLPIVGGVDVDSPQPGQLVESDEVLAALKAYRSLPGQLRSRIRGVFAPTVERLSFSLEGGTLIRYGAAERLRAKNQVLIAVMQRLRAQDRSVAYIDVRVPTNPAVGEAPVPVVVTAPVEPEPSPTPSPSPSASPEDD
jgi:cell division protein FtsQ